MEAGAGRKFFLAPTQVQAARTHRGTKCVAEWVKVCHLEAISSHFVWYGLHTMSVIRVAVERGAGTPLRVRPSLLVPWQAVSGAVSEGLAESLEPLMSIDEVATVLSISQRGVYRLIGRGELVAVKVGSCTRIEPQELRSYITECRRLMEKESA